MSAIFQCGNVRIDRPPIVGDHHHPTFGGELTWNIAAIQGAGVALPAQRLDRIGLAQGFEQTNAATIAIQAVHVVQDDRLVAVLVDRSGGSPISALGAV